MQQAYLKGIFDMVLCLANKKKLKLAVILDAAALTE